jgi:hypothetical protein
VVSVLDSNGVRISQLRASSTFEIIDSWDDDRFANGFGLIYSDRFILAETLRPQQWFKREFSPPLDNGNVAEFPRYHFLNDDTLVTYSGYELTVRRVDGTEVFRETLPTRNLFFGFWSRPAISRAARDSP